METFELSRLDRYFRHVTDTVGPPGPPAARSLLVTQPPGRTTIVRTRRRPRRRARGGAAQTQEHRPRRPPADHRDLPRRREVPDADRRLIAETWLSHFNHTATGAHR